MRTPISLGLLMLGSATWGATLQVGPGQTYSKPCQAIAAAQPGDTILVDALGNGTYDGDSCAWSTDALTLKGINGRASINAGGTPVGGSQSNIAQDKGIFVIAADNATIENFELSGAVADPSSNNGAGIRHQGTNLTVRNCYFHDNQDGILGSPPVAGTGTVLIESSEFAKNGAGDGYSHNMYIGDYQLFTLRYSYSHESVIGHLVKSRALETHLEYNLLADLQDGTGSYEVDIPQGGLTYLIGNAIEQSQAGANSGNPTIITYAEESQANPVEVLYVIANTVVNDADKGTFVHTGGTPQVTLVDNIFRGAGSAPTAPTFATFSNNWTDAQGDPLLVDQANFNYLLMSNSPCVGAGVDPGSGNGEPLEPAAQYLAPLSGQLRDNARWDIGAFEFDDQGPALDGGLPSTSGSSTSGSSTVGSSTTGGAGTTSASNSTSTTGGASAGGSAGTTSTGGANGGATSGSTAGTNGGTSGSTRSSTTGSSSKGTSAGCGCGSASSPLDALCLVILAVFGGSRRRHRS